jgi:uncharacterized repeat protein (TIGR01451 family)
MVAIATSAEKQNAVSVKYKNVSVSFVPQPLKVDSKLLPMIDATMSTANKERFGIHLGGLPVSTTILEILDANEAVVKAISVNDMVGKGISREGDILPANGTKLRRAANTYKVRLPQGEAELIVRAIATGDEPANDQQLVLTFALKTTNPCDVALRLRLPFSGNGEASTNGFVILTKSGAGALAASVVQSKLVTVDKSTVVITSVPKTLVASQEIALLWLVIKGVSTSSGASPTDAKTQALRVITDHARVADQPDLVIVNTADKERLGKTDTTQYSIVCANIGTGDATQVVVGNPIPKGARYIAGSATSEGAQLKEEKENAEVQNLKWTFSAPLKPGAEKIVSFKVVLQ